MLLYREAVVEFNMTTKYFVDILRKTLIDSLLIGLKGMQGSREVDELDCDICRETLHASDTVNIPSCCATDTELKLICTVCMPKLNDSCPYCKQPTIQINHITIALNDASIMQNINTLPTHITLLLLGILKRFLCIDIANEIHKSELITSTVTLAKTQPQQALKRIIGLIRQDLISPERSLTSLETSATETDKKNAAIISLIAIIIAPSLHTSIGLNQALCSIHQQLPEQLTPLQTDELIKITIKNPRPEKLISAFALFKQQLSTQPLLNRVFMAKIQSALGQSITSQQLLEHILEHKNQPDKSIIDHACQFFAYCTLQKEGVTESDAYQLYHANTVYQDESLPTNQRESLAINATLKAIRAPHNTCLDQSLEYLIKILPPELSEVMVRTLISMTVELVGKNHDTKALRLLLKHCQLMPLFMNENQASANVGSWLLSFVLQPKLTSRYAEALVVPDKHLYIQKEGYQLFFARLKKTNINRKVCDLHAQIEQNLIKNGKIIDYRY